MTSLVNDLTVDVARSGSSLGIGVDAVAVILLVVLLIEQELLRAHEAPSWPFQARTLQNAAVPLSMMFVVVVTAHLLDRL